MDIRWTEFTLDGKTKPRSLRTSLLEEAENRHFRDVRAESSPDVLLSSLECWLAMILSNTICSSGGIGTLFAMMASRSTLSSLFA